LRLRFDPVEAAAVKQHGVEMVSEVLRRVVRTLDMEARLLTHSVEPAWPRAAGPRLAPHTRATKLQGGVLTVEARSASWLNEMSLMRDSLRDQLNQELGGTPVREIRLRLGGAFPAILRERGAATATEEEVESARRILRENGDTGAQIAARAFALRKKTKS
jgi:hypothetical protein